MSAKKRRGARRPPAQGAGKATKRERREEIRQARIEAQRRRMRARRRRQIMTWGLAGLVVLIGAGFVLFRSIEGRTTALTAAKEAGCTDVEEFEALPAIHIDSAEAPPTPPPYNSDPPTSGPHLGAQVAPWGSHPETVPPEIFVHNLEHGGIVIHYKDLPDEDIVALEELVDSYDDGVIVMPSDSINKPLALTQWAHMQTCEKYSERVVVDFIRARCNKGNPEPTPTTTCRRG